MRVAGYVIEPFDGAVVPVLHLPTDKAWEIFDVDGHTACHALGHRSGLPRDVETLAVDHLP